MNERVERPARPVLVFDGDCGFCRRSIRWLEDRAEGAFETTPAGDLGERLPQVDRNEAGTALIHVDTDGRVRRGFAATCKALAAIPGHGLPWMLYRWLPGYGVLGEINYRVMAAHRGQLSRVLDVLSGPQLSSTWNIGRRLFVLWLGLVHAVWFLSLFGQLDLLIGSDGLLPLDRTIAGAADTALWDVPTVLRVGGANWLPWVVCGLGVLTGLVLAAGVLARWCLMVLYLCQLSLMQVGGLFLLHEGDVLLLEATLLALLLVPGGSRPDWRSRTLPAGRWLLLFLLVRAVSLPAFAHAGNATEWLRHWLPTQPLPSVFALWCAGLPPAVLSILSVMMLAVAALAPWLLFTFRRVRLFAAAALGIECAALAALGTHGVAPLVLAGVLLLAVDDGTWLRLRWLRGRTQPSATALPRWSAFAHGSAALLLTVAAVLTTLLPGTEVAQVLARFGAGGFHGDLWREQQWRPVLIVQGSANGTSWHPYEPRYQPGSGDRAPAWAVGHLPRLEQALAIAALQAIAGAPPPWLGHLAARLLQKNSAVEAAFAAVPFPDLASKPVLPEAGTSPKVPPSLSLIRFMLYRYEPAPAQGRAEGLWWQRREIERVGPQDRLGG